MKRFFAELSRRFTGGEATLATQPILAGYRREVAPGWRIIIVLALALASFAYGVAFAYMAPARMMPLVVPLALLCGLVIWALPDGDYAPTRLLEPMFVAFFAALVLWPNYLAIALPSLPWITLLRAIGLPLVAVLLVCISTSQHFRSRLGKVLLTDKAIIWLIIAIVAMQTITLPLSRDPVQTINRWIVAQTNWTFMFILSCVVFMRPGFAELWTRLLLILLYILCAYAFWEIQLSHVPWAGQIPSFLRVEDEHVLRVLSGFARAATGIYRVQGPSTTPLGFAELLGLAIPFAMHLAIGRYRLYERIFGIVFIPLSVVVILMTDSRLGVVAAIASLAFYLLLWALIRWRESRNSVIAPAIVLAYPAIFAVMVASTFFVGRLRNEVWGDGSQQASTDSRIAQWEMGLPKVFRNPIGHGVGEGGSVLGFTNAAGVGSIDSYYLSILLEIGVIGFIVYYGFFLRAIWIASAAAIKSKGQDEFGLLLPLSVSIINYVIVKSVLSQDANHPLAFMMVGAVVALIFRIRNPELSSKT